MANETKTAREEDLEIRTLFEIRNILSACDFPISITIIK